MLQRLVMGRPAAVRTRVIDDEGEPVAGVGEVSALVRSDRTGAVWGPIVAAEDADVWSSALPPEAVAVLDTLHVEWTADVGGQPWTWRTTAEVAGGHVFTLADVRTHSTLKPEKTEPELVQWARREAEDALERRCGFAFVPRYGVWPVRRSDDVGVIPVRRVRAIVGVRVAGIPVMPHTVSVSAGGAVSGLSALTTGETELLLEHGADHPPGGAWEAALLLAADMLNNDRDPRLIRRGRDNGDFEVFYTQDAEAGAFPIPEVESFCRRFPGRVVLPG